MPSPIPSTASTGEATSTDNRLIRKRATTAEVAFEFIQGGHRYRVERSITRKTGRHGEPRPDAKHVQASLWSDSDQAWVAIPDTDKATELEKWVKSLLGMGPESFRSAVLLRQGEADKLLNAKASQRFQILAGLIDLRAYQQLEQLALSRRKTADAEADLLDQQLASIDHVTGEQVSEAAGQLTTAERAAETADRKRLEAFHRCQGAQHHAGLQARHSELARRKADVDAIVSDALNIRSRAAEHNQIKKMIEPATAALADLHEAAAAADEADEALTQLDAIDLAALESAAAETETAWQELDKDLDHLNDRAAGSHPCSPTPRMPTAAGPSRPPEHNRLPRQAILHNFGSWQNAWPRIYRQPSRKSANSRPPTAWHSRATVPHRAGPTSQAVAQQA